MKLKSLVLAATMTLASISAGHTQSIDETIQQALQHYHYVDEQIPRRTLDTRPSNTLITDAVRRAIPKASQRVLNRYSGLSDRSRVIYLTADLIQARNTINSSWRRTSHVTKERDAYLQEINTLKQQNDNLNTLYNRLQHQYQETTNTLQRQNRQLREQLNKQPDVVYKERVIRKETQETKKLREENTQLQQENQRLHKQYQRQLTITQNQQEHIQKLPNNTILPQQLYIQLGEDLYSFPNKQLLCEQTKQGISCIHLEDVIEHHKNQ